jgi:hypothetical protein
MSKGKEVKKIKRGWRGRDDEYEYNGIVYITARIQGYTTIHEKQHMDKTVMRSKRFEDYRPFIKRFKEFITSKPISND